MGTDANAGADGNYRRRGASDCTPVGAAGGQETPGAGAAERHDAPGHAGGTRQRPAWRGIRLVASGAEGVGGARLGREGEVERDVSLVVQLANEIAQEHLERNDPEFVSKMLNLEELLDFRRKAIEHPEATYQEGLKKERERNQKAVAEAKAILHPQKGRERA
jgi:hypothetical protein